MQALAHALRYKVRAGAGACTVLQQIICAQKRGRLNSSHQGASCNVTSWATRDAAYEAQRSQSPKLSAACLRAARRLQQTHRNHQWHALRRPYSLRSEDPAPTTSSAEKLPHASSSDRASKGFFGSAAGLGLFGTAAFFSKRALLVLGGKSVWGLFSIVSFKKFIFLPAWIWVMMASGGASAAWWFTTNRAPITRRQQAITTTSEQEAFLGVKTLEQLLHSGLQLRPPQHAASKRVLRVGQKLKHCLALLEDEPHRKHWLTLDWEFRVATAALKAHAFSLPLGTIVISERLLDVFKSDDQLAFVIAHEMAHLMARHAGESVSRNMYWVTLTSTLREHVGIEAESRMVQLFLQLPYARTQEYEADHIAMVLLSKACYNVAAGIEAFELLRKHDASLDAPAWLQHWSTHPTTAARMVAMKALIPEVLHESPCHYEHELRAAMAAAARDSTAQQASVAR